MKLLCLSCLDLLYNKSKKISKQSNWGISNYETVNSANNMLCFDKSAYTYNICLQYVCHKWLRNLVNIFEEINVFILLN